MMTIMACLETGLFLIVFFFFKEKVFKDPWEESEQGSELQIEEPFKEQLKSLLSDVNYLLLMFASSLMVGVTYLFPTVMEQVLLPYHYDSQEVSTYGVVYNATGIAGGIITTIFLLRVKSFKLFTIILPILALISFAVYHFWV